MRRNFFGIALEPQMSVLNRLIQEKDVCFDIGASYGRYTFLMSRLAGAKGHVYSFEPGNSSGKTFARVIKFHGLSNITFIKKALSNQEGPAYLVIPIKETGSLGEPIARLGKEDETNAVIEKVETVTLDRYCLEQGLSRVDFIKCDVEGSEMLFLEGAKQTLLRHKPILLCEISPPTLHYCSNHLHHLLALLSVPGYCVFRVAQGELREVEDTDSPGDFFFIHENDPFLAGQGRVSPGLL